MPFMWEGSQQEVERLSQRNTQMQIFYLTQNAGIQQSPSAKFRTSGALHHLVTSNYVVLLIHTHSALSHVASEEFIDSTSATTI